jgi:cell division protein FtsW
MFSSSKVLKKIRHRSAGPLFFHRQYHQPDVLLIALTALLVVGGLMFLSSASSVVGFQRYGDVGYFLKGQIIKGVLPGILFFLFFSLFDYKNLKKMAPWLLISSAVLLVAVFIPGLGAGYGKASSWLKLGPINFQPTELVKIFFLVYLAAWLENKQKTGALNNLKYGMMPFVVTLGILGALIMAQPDFGTFLIIVAISCGVYFLAHAPLKHFVLLFGAGAIMLLLLAFMAPYRMARLTSFINPEKDPLGSGYQINQAKIAVGSGGWLGLGIGKSKQKFQYLPEVQADSIFAVIAEEMGFIFTSILVGLFLLFGFRAFRISTHAPDVFGQLLAGGIGIWLSMQALINIATMTGFFPLTGIPLPFISAGGTAMAVSLAVVGILINISKQTKNA